MGGHTPGGRRASPRLPMVPLQACREAQRVLDIDSSRRVTQESEQRAKKLLPGFPMRLPILQEVNSSNRSTTECLSSDLSRFLIWAEKT
ncbi:hypothetical protein E2C01_053935 [Portunus trituberculatus]|uniref:Uncharacterized protein n=1 Tax=Portunus trituberculatus TaxID=210409 RepID=A0A5B7GQN2_PORTR|nr:hypothetical protein [Portunus trituberculatus]